MFLEKFKEGFRQKTVVQQTPHIAEFYIDAYKIRQIIDGSKWFFQIDNCKPFHIPYDSDTKLMAILLEKEIQFIERKSTESERQTTVNVNMPAPAHTIDVTTTTKRKEPKEESKEIEPTIKVDKLVSELRIKKKRRFLEYITKSKFTKDTPFDILQASILAGQVNKGVYQFTFNNMNVIMKEDGDKLKITVNESVTSELNAVVSAAFVIKTLKALKYSAVTKTIAAHEEKRRSELSQYPEEQLSWLLNWISTNYKKMGAGATATLVGLLKRAKVVNYNFNNIPYDCQRCSTNKQTVWFNKYYQTIMLDFYVEFYRDVEQSDKQVSHKSKSPKHKKKKSRETSTSLTSVTTSPFVSVGDAFGDLDFDSIQDKIVIKKKEPKVEETKE